MPARKISPTKTGSGSKKKKGFLSRWSSTSRKVPGDFFRGAEDAVTGFPTGVVALAHALDQALPKSPIPGVDESHKATFGDRGPLKKLGKEIARQTAEDIRHPLRDPFATSLNLLTLGTVGLGAPVKVAGGISKAAKVSGKAAKVKEFKKAVKRPATRKIKTIRRPATHEPVVYGGVKMTKSTSRPSRELELEANPNPLVRGLRKITLDPLYERSRLKAEADIDNPKAGRYARMVERRTLDQRERYAENIRRQMSGEGPEEVAAGDDLVKNIFGAPMDLMRLNMYLRPRYYLQNLGGTSALLAHAGVSATDIKDVIKIARSDPELYGLMKAAGGETGTKAIQMGTAGTGRLGQLSRKAADKANEPEAHMRTAAVWKAAKDYGVESPDELKAILKDPESDLAQLIMSRGNESVVDYGRIGGSGVIGKREKQFVKTGLPIFYPMMKGFSRYASRFPTQHPLQSAAIAQIGDEGKDIQRQGVRGEPQPWFPYITPLSGGRTLNLQNIYPFSPGGDVTRQTAQALPGAERHPTLNLLQALGPAAELATGLVSGRQLATGFEYDTDLLDKYGSAGAALIDTAQSVVPGLEYAFPRTSAAYGTPSLEDRLMLALVGPGLYPRKTDYKKVRQPKKRKKGRPKSRGNSRF